MFPYIAIPIVIIAGYLISKRYQTHAVLLLTGLLLISLALLNDDHTNFLPKNAKPTGSLFVDLFELITAIFATRAGAIGMIIMSAAGFAKYMAHIGAADTLVSIAIRPLSLLRSPYLILALSYIVGQVLNIFIPSAAGLAMLLLVSMYPILVKLGVSPAAAAGMIATTACLDLGPASGAANTAAKTADIDVALYFFQYQLPVAVPTIIVISLLHFFVQRYFDNKDQSWKNNESDGQLTVTTEIKQAPKIYAILPLLPLSLLLTFSDLGIKGVKMDVVTAMFISLFVSMLFELVYKLKIKSVLADITVFFSAMGNVFAKVVTLIVAAEVFATGLTSIGFIDLLINSAQNLGVSAFIMTTLLVVIIGLTAFLTGSGNAAFFSFAHLAPNIAGSLGIPAIVILMPMQLAAGICRSLSPVAGVVIAVAGAAGISPLDVVKRTFIPMVGGLFTMMVASYMFY